MATVSSTLKLQDQMTPVLKSILKSMSLMMKTMGDLDHTAASAGFSRHFGLTERAIKEANSALDAFEQTLDGIKNPIEEGGAGFSGWQANLMGVNAAVSLVQSGIQSTVGLIQKGVAATKDWVSEMNGAYNNQLNPQVQFAVSAANQGFEKSDFYDAMDKAAELQGRSLYGDELYISGGAELATYLDDPRALERAMDTLATYATGMSGGAELTMQQMVEYATQLGKGFDGTLDGLKKKGFDLTEEQKAIVETGTAMERVAVIADVIEESWGGLESAMARTPSGALAQLKNYFGDIKEEVGAELSPALVELFGLLREQLPLVRDLMLEGGEAAKAGIGVLTHVILPMAVTGLEWLNENIGAVKFGLLLLGSAALIVGGAFALMSFLMAAPFLLAAVGIGIYVKTLYDMGASSEEVIMGVSKLIGGLYTIGYNAFAGLYNANAFFLELSGNAWVDFRGTAGRAFTSLADLVLYQLEVMARAIDAVLGSGLSDAVAGFRDNLADWSAEKFGEAAIQLPRMEYKSMDQGIQEVAGLADNLLSGLNNLEPFDLETDLLDTLNWGGDGGGMADALEGLDEIGHVGSVGRIDDEVSLSEEDVKLLRDLASRDYQLSYIQLTPQATFGETHIHNEADADAIMTQLEDFVEQSLQSSLVVV